MCSTLLLIFCFVCTWLTLFLVNIYQGVLLQRLWWSMVVCLWGKVCLYYYQCGDLFHFDYHMMSFIMLLFHQGGVWMVVDRGRILFLVVFSGFLVSWDGGDSTFYQVDIYPGVFLLQSERLLVWKFLYVANIHRGCRFVYGQYILGRL